jgi:carbon storage regulator CsrA
MLVLSRAIHESIVIRTPDGYTIRIFPTRIRGDRVRIGIEADRSVVIRREEIPPSKAA